MRRIHSRLLKAILPHREMGWEEIGEEFTRFTLLWTPWFSVYLHRLYCPIAHPQCHDHPWSFVSLILKGGYMEYTKGKNEWRWRLPGSVLWRPAHWTHNVITHERASWSIIITGARRREWGFHSCHE